MANVTFSLDELGDWAVTYHLDLRDIYDSEYSVSELRTIENFISYLKRETK